MSEFRILAYIKKYRWYIVVVSLALGAAFYLRFSSKQSYTAEAVIKYTNPEAEDGLAPDGTEIDTSEIYSTQVMTAVFQKMGLNYDKKNLDAIRANIKVTPIKTEEEEAVQEALNEKGETLNKEPTSFKVSYVVGVKEANQAKKFASDIISNMLIVYSETYAEDHINKTIAVNDVGRIYEGDYDYIEMAELLESSISKAKENLQYRKDVEFRSVATGYTFKDLYAEFNLLSEIDVPNIYAYVLDNRITKDQEVLLTKYRNRIKNSSLSNQTADSQIVGIDEIINSYVRMLRESGNTNFTQDYILDQVYENYYKDITADSNVDKYKNVEVTTEYDKLMNRFVKSRTDYEYELINMAYNQYILETYSMGVSPSALEIAADSTAAGQSIAGSAETAQPAASSPVTAQSAASSPDTAPIPSDTAATDQVPEQPRISSTPEELEQANQMVAELSDRLDSLYDILQITNEEYNKYAGAENISIMTDTAVHENINLLVYAILAVVLFGVIGCVMAIVVGRALEVFDYYAYVDKNLGIPNRSGCDKFMRQFEGKLLPPGFTSILIRMPDIRDKNQKYGREACDGMMRDFINIAKQFLPANDSFMAVNSLGQFVFFVQNVSKEYARVYIKEILEQCRVYNKTHECKITFTCGLSTSDADQIFEVKRLMIDAVKKASPDKEI